MCHFMADMGKIWNNAPTINLYIWQVNIYLDIKYLPWCSLWVFEIALQILMWSPSFFLGMAKINHFYSDSNFQQWVLCCHWLFIYSIPIGLDAKKGKIVKDTRYSHITEMILSLIWNLVVWIILTKEIHKIDTNY